jgi:site-specific DNA-methyltransferase (adenine-specific)
VDRESHRPAKEIAAGAEPSEPIRIEKGKQSITLHHGDCVAGMKRLSEGSIDVAVTSPPYNIGIRYSSYRDKRPREDYLEWIAEVGREVRRVLAPDGSFFLNVGNKPTDPWIAWDVVSRLRGTFVLQNVIHWIKAISIGKDDAGAAAGLGRDLSVGHYKPINSERYLNDAQEFVFHLTRGGDTKVERLAIGVPYQDKSNIARWAHTKKKDLRCRGNCWFVPYETIQHREKDRPHPATFPVKLAEMCLKVHGAKKGSTVLDPFLGLGSTAIAAAKLGADAVGFDVDVGYLAVAERRIREALSVPSP